MDYIEILQEMLRYIDTNIADKESGEKMSVEKLAARAGFSPYHFCRVFQWNVGYSIIEYVRNRRLAFAASELNSGLQIFDIAIQYGFETHSGFTKAFRRRFGCPPEKYRMHATFDVPKLPVIKKSQQYVTGGIIMEPKMVKKPAIKLAGLLLKTRTLNSEHYTTVPKFWQDCRAGGRIDKLHSEPFLKSHAEYGACFLERPEDGEFEYVIGVEVKDGHDIPLEYHVCTIPEALFAVFTSPPADKSNFVSAVQGTWKYIFSEWFPTSGYEYVDNGVDFEFYNEHHIKETGNVCDIYIPVFKKST